MDYYDLGSYSRPVTTPSVEAQRWFDRGLAWTYAFNHEEAVRCFERAIAADPDCAMAHWGVAYALGPNYNKPWEFFDDVELTSTVERTHAAAEAAAKVARETGTDAEQDLTEALQYRYPADHVRTEGDVAQCCSIWNVEYANAMREVYRRHGADPDVATLFADALMNMTPWQLWDVATGEPAPGSHALEAKDVLERALATADGRNHPGVLHMYIHLVEMSACPEQGLVAADRLRDLVPDGGHMHHMPTHLDVLCGDYRRVVSSNSAAIVADEKFLQRRGPMNFYTLYRSHDYHFKIYGAMFLGQRAVALETVQQLEDSIPEDLLRVPTPPMADWLEGFVAMRVHVLIRFGMWQDIIDLALPADADLYCATTAMTHYAKGVAFAATGAIGEAREQRELFHASLGRVPETRMLFNNTCVDILGVAAAMLDGEICYREGDYDRAYDALRRSIQLSDRLPYDEPWGWMQPPRHAYGALLLEQGHLEEAAATYRADLGLDDTLPRACQHPNNVWALHGYHECLLRLGRAEEANIIGKQLTFAAACADVAITASCFCRTMVDEATSGGEASPCCAD